MSLCVTKCASNNVLDILACRSVSPNVPLTFQFKLHIPSSQLLQHPPEPICHLEDAAIMIL